MKIVVCVKAVPSSTKVRMDPVTHTLIRDGRQSVINPMDSSALEVGIQIREKLGGHVTAISMGIPDTVRLLRDCVSRGADSGILLSDRAFAGADTLATSYALGQGILTLCEKEGESGTSAAGSRRIPDLILCGKMAVDGDTAQIGPELAGVLGIFCVTDVQEIMNVTAEEVTVRRGTDRGSAIVKVQLPAVLTVVKDIANPRMPSISGIIQAEKAEIAVWTAMDVGADPARCGLAGSATKVVKTFVPERTHESVLLQGSVEEKAADILTLIGKVR